MSRPRVPDDLWAAVAALWPCRAAQAQGRSAPLRGSCGPGWPRLRGSRLGLSWEMLSRELGCLGVPCWRRLRDWQGAGVWAGLHRVLLERRSGAGHPDRSRAALASSTTAARQQHDSSTVAVRGAPRPGRTQRIAGQTGPDAPPRGRPPGHPLRRAPEPGRPARQPPAGAHPRRRARCPSRPGPSQDAPQQASRRHGLRSPSRPRGVPGPLRHAASRRASPDAGSTAATASVGTAGWWSARAPGSAASGVWRSASRPATSGAANIHGAFALLGCALPCLNQIRELV